MKKTISIIFLLAFSFACAGAASACIDPRYYAKLPNSSAIYYVTPEFRYVFPDAKTFYTYFTSYSSNLPFKLASEDQPINGIKISDVKNGGIMKYKALTKKLIKHVNSPKVYAVDKEQKLHWIETGDILQKLGYSFSDINDLAEVFFISYDIGAPISKPVHLDGSIIKYRGDNKVYRIENGAKRHIIVIDDALGGAIQPPSVALDKYKDQYLEADPSVIYPDGEDYRDIINGPVPACG